MIEGFRVYIHFLQIPTLRLEQKEDSVQSTKYGVRSTLKVIRRLQ